MTRRRATGKQRTSGDTGRRNSGGDHLDQLLDDGDDQDRDQDDDGDADDHQEDDDEDVDGDDQDADTDEDNLDQDRSRGRRRGRKRRQTDRDQDDDENADDDRTLTVEDLERAAQRIADRQVNALLRRLDRGDLSRRDGDRDRDDRGGRRRDDRDRSRNRDDRDGDGDRDDSRRREDDQRRYDQREAALVFRDYLAGDGRTLATSEREIATSLSRVEITSRLDEHGDPDRAGREAAERVTDQLATFRRLVERQTVAALRKRGALRERGSSTQDGEDDDTELGGNSGGSRPPGRAPAPSKLADKRQAAKSIAADYNARIGHTTSTDAGKQAG